MKWETKPNFKKKIKSDSNQIRKKASASNDGGERDDLTPRSNFNERKSCPHLNARQRLNIDSAPKEGRGGGGEGKEEEEERERREEGHLSSPLLQSWFGVLTLDWLLPGSKFCGVTTPHQSLPHHSQTISRHDSFFFFFSVRHFVFTVRCACVCASVRVCECVSVWVCESFPRYPARPIYLRRGDGASNQTQSFFNEWMMFEEWRELIRALAQWNVGRLMDGRITRWWIDADRWRNYPARSNSKQVEGGGGPGGGGGGWRTRRRRTRRRRKRKRWPSELEKDIRKSDSISDDSMKIAPSNRIVSIATLHQCSLELTRFRFSFNPSSVSPNPSPPPILLHFCPGFLAPIWPKFPIDLEPVPQCEWVDPNGLPVASIEGLGDRFRHHLARFQAATLQWRTPGDAFEQLATASSQLDPSHWTI